MIQLNTQTAPSVVEYPEDDGLPMADNSKQFWWITTIAANLAGLYRDREDVFVGGNMLWYAREGDPAERFAPDVFVVFGRPKGPRSSYKQWEEDDVPMTVVFEILSPSNTRDMMTDKVLFYSDYGAEEFYTYDPDTNELKVYIRGRAILRRVYKVADFVSPNMGIRFDLSGPELVLRHADGRPFLTVEELEAERVRLTDERDRVTAERDRATDERDRVTDERDRVTDERDAAITNSEKLQRRLERIAELLPKQLTSQIRSEELAELQRLLLEP